MGEVRGSIPLKSTRLTGYAPFGAFFFGWRRGRVQRRPRSASRYRDLTASILWKRPEARFVLGPTNG